MMDYRRLASRGDKSSISNNAYQLKGYLGGSVGGVSVNDEAISMDANALDTKENKQLDPSQK